MKKQTAVQWLIYEYFGGMENCTPDFKYHIHKALQMEKEQMKSSYNDGKLDAYRQDDVPTAEEYIYQKYKL